MLLEVGTDLAATGLAATDLTPAPLLAVAVLLAITAALATGAFGAAGLTVAVFDGLALTAVESVALRLPTLTGNGACALATALDLATDGLASALLALEASTLGAAFETALGIILGITLGSTLLAAIVAALETTLETG